MQTCNTLRMQGMAEIAKQQQEMAVCISSCGTGQDLRIEQDTLP